MRTKARFQVAVVFLGCLSAAICPSVAAQAVNLVTNPGFETGDFTGWTATPRVAPGSSFGVGGNAHSGSSAAYFNALFYTPNPSQGFDKISQALSTTPKTFYKLSFWLADGSGNPPEDFRVFFGGVLVAEVSNATGFPYTHYEVTGLASTGASTILEFQAYDQAGFFLDDIVVTAVPPPDEDLGNGNTGEGEGALLSLTTGYDNTGLGFQALFSNGAGFGNTASGSTAMVQNVTGNLNVATGFEALNNNVSGSNNIGIGYYGGFNLTADNNVAIGNAGVAGESNTIRIGEPVTYTNGNNVSLHAHTATFIAGIYDVDKSLGRPVFIDANGQLGTANLGLLGFLPGPKGDKGDTGAQGPQGIKGDTGAAGPQGVKGDTGVAGSQGPQGTKGDTGAAGPIGPQGPAPVSNSWATKSPMPTARSSGGAASINGVIYVVGGGQGFCGPVSTVEAYDAATDTWTTKASMPTPRYSIGVVAVNQILYAIGGGANCSDAGDKAVVEAYDPATNTWTTKAPLPVASRDVSATAIAGIIYVVSNEQFPSTLLAYNPATNIWTTKSVGTTPSRSGGAVAALNGIIYWSGGSDSAVDAYNPATDSWTRKASTIPTSRFNPGVGVVGCRIYFVGGAGQNTAVDAYDPGTDTWTVETSMPTGRDAVVAVANGVLYAFGGNQPGFASKFATNEAYTPDFAGCSGSQGAKGDKGDSGANGAAGTQGVKGDKGDVGAAGPQGLKGDTGGAGPKGDTGAAGPRGLQGSQGLAGIPGVTGPQGPAGLGLAPSDLLFRLSPSTTPTGGFVKIGTIQQTLKDLTGHSATVTLDVYQKKVNQLP